MTIIAKQFNIESAYTCLGIKLLVRVGSRAGQGSKEEKKPQFMTKVKYNKLSKVRNFMIIVIPIKIGTF